MEIMQMKLGTVLFELLSEASWIASKPFKGHELF
jgi:hypothetical protein